MAQSAADRFLMESKIGAANGVAAVGPDGKVSTPLPDLSADYRRTQSGRKVSACVADGSDQTAVVQAEIDALRTFGGGVVELPGGDIILDGVVMKHRVSVCGAGAFATRIKAKAGSSNKAVFLLDSGPVQQAWVRDVRIMPNGNAGQCGIYFKARDAAGGFTDPCGWWDGGLANVQVGDDSAQFASHGIWLSGGGNTYQAPHQWLTFENVHVAASATGCALLLSGQVGQVVIINGGYNGRSPDSAVTTGTTKSGVDIYVAQQLDDAGANLTATYPYGITVVGSSIQSNGQGVRVDGGNALHMLNPHFEDTAVCAYVNNAYLSWTGGRASNVHNAAGTGCVARTGNTGRVTVSGVRSYGTVDQHFDGFVQAGANMLGNNPVTANMTWQVTPDSTGWVDMRDRSTAIMNTSANVLKTIDSELPTGSVLYLKAHGGSVQIGTGGNISMGGKTSPYTLPSGAVATFAKFDLSGTWFLTSTSA